jgi:DNA transposition AAA+ family ATPase
MDHIQTALEQDARTVKERIPMVKEKAQQVAGALKSFIADHDYSQRRIAEMLGVSSAQINQFLSGKYQGDTVALAAKVVNLINSITRKDKRVKNKPYIETSVARKIGTLITQTESFSDDEGKIGLIIGDGGCGKSKCMQAYADANRNTLYIQLDDAMTSTLMFAATARDLGLDSSGSLAAVTRRLIEHLQNRHIIVMLDEASHLTIRHLNQLRQIIVIKSRCPLILAGNSDLLKTVMQPSARRGCESLDQFRSRLMQILNLDKLASDKAGGLYTAEDIRKLYEFGGLKLSGDAVSTLQRIARTRQSGRLRTCSHIIAALLTTSHRTITADLIVSAIAQLDLPVGVWLPVDHVAAEPDENTAQVMAG